MPTLGGRKNCTRGGAWSRRSRERARAPAQRPALLTLSPHGTRRERVYARRWSYSPKKSVSLSGCVFSHCFHVMAMTCATTTWAEQKRAFRRGREERGARGGAGPRRGSRGARAYLADDLRDVVVAEGLAGALGRERGRRREEDRRRGDGVRRVLRVKLHRRRGLGRAHGHLRRGRREEGLGRGREEEEGEGGLHCLEEVDLFTETSERRPPGFLKGTVRAYAQILKSTLFKSLSYARDEHG